MNVKNIFLVSCVLLVSVFFAHTFYAKKNSTSKTDLVVFSYDRPIQLYAFLESTQKYVTGIAEQKVVYRASNDEFEKGYQEVKNKFSGVTFLQQGKHPKADFKPLTLRASFNSPAEYIIFAVDDIILKDYVDLQQCAQLIEEHDAYGFYLRLGKNVSFCYPENCQMTVPPLQEVCSGVFSWHFNQARQCWGYPHTVDMTLFRKKDIQHAFERLPYASPNQLEGNWAGLAGYVRNKKGLCFTHSKIVNLPLNRMHNDYQNRHMNFMTAQELLDEFNKGSKIDIQPLFKVANKSAHMEYEPTFVTR